MAQLAGLSLLNDANLKAYYKLEDVNDTIGGFTLTNNNSVTFNNTGQYANAASTGTTNATKYLSVLNNVGIDGGAITLNMWYKPNEQPANNTEFMCMTQQSNTSHTEYGVAYQQIATVFRCSFFRSQVSIADAELLINGALTTGVWYMLTLTYDGTTLTPYINAVAGSTTTTSGDGAGTTTTGVFLFARNRTSVGSYNSGQLDDVAIFSRALTSDEVTTLFNDSVGLKNNFSSRLRPGVFSPGLAR